MGETLVSGWCVMKVRRVHERIGGVAETPQKCIYTHAFVGVFP